MLPSLKLSSFKPSLRSDCQRQENRETKRGGMRKRKKGRGKERRWREREGGNEYDIQGKKEKCSTI